MAGDGISLQTSIAQLGNVAKTQAKGQQAQQPAAPFADQLDRHEDLRVQRVKETDKSEKGTVDPEKEKKRKDRRRERRRKRRLQSREVASADDRERDDEEDLDAAAAGETGEGEATAALGGLIDTRV